MSQKSLITIFLSLFVASSCLLFWQNERELDPDRGKSWWTLSFFDLQQTESLVFTVENHSDHSRFNYEIRAGNNSLLKESFIVEKGSSITITPEQQAIPNTRTSIIVSDETEKKEIYR